MTDPRYDTGAHQGPHPSWWRRSLLRLGIDATAEQRFRVCLRPRFFAILGSTIGAAFLGVLATAAYSESPSFCRSCHIMEPYYQAWHSSKHKDVACVEC